MIHEQGRLSAHILPSSGTMVGVCVTLIGLVKIVEARIGPSRVDEYAGIASLFFLASAMTSYISMRKAERTVLGASLETAADVLFLTGLVSITLIAFFFAYETI
jgi:hypothetical protein